MAGSEEARIDAEQWLPQGSVAASEGLDCLSLPPRQSGRPDGPCAVLRAPNSGVFALLPTPIWVLPAREGLAFKLPERGLERWGAVTGSDGTHATGPSLGVVGGLSATPGIPRPRPCLHFKSVPLSGRSLGPSDKATRQARGGSECRRWDRGRWEGHLLREPRRVTAPHAGPAATQER